MNSRIFRDVIWVSLTQGLGAVGQLFAIRLLTTNLTPEIFGITNLIIGIIALFSAIAIGPTSQAILRFYAEFINDGKENLVSLAAKNQVLVILSWIAPGTLIFTCILLYFENISLFQIIIVLLLLTVELIRSFRLAILNSISSHQIYGLWVLLETWLRPLTAYLLIRILGASVDVTLIGFFIATFILNILFKNYIPKNKVHSSNKFSYIKAKYILWKYSKPLLPLGFIGWITGMSDRYIIATWLSPYEVGLYAAIYGLASRPILMSSNVIEIILRPILQKNISIKDVKSTKKYLNIWIIVLILVCLLLFIISIVIHGWITTLFLGETFRNVSSFLPWIVAGYSILAISHIFTRICYASGGSSEVLKIETSGSVAAFMIGLILIKSYGLPGAFYSIPIYFTLQLAFSIYFSIRHLKKLK